MSPLLQLIAIGIPVGLLVVIVVGIRRMTGVRGRRGGVSSGVANWLVDLNAMLQPQQPTAEVLAQVQEADEEDEDQGDGNDPEAVPPSAHQ